MRRRGFTVLEALFAAFLLALTFMALMNILPTAILAEKKAQQRLMADSVGEAVLEKTRVAAFSAIPVGADLPLGDVTLDGTVFHGSETVASESPRLKDIQVTVTWDDPGFAKDSEKKRTLVLEAEIVDLNR